MKEAGLKRASVARAVGIPYRTLQEWETNDAPPRTGRERIARLEDFLREAIAKKSGGTMKINDSRFNFREEPIRYAEPFDFKKDALTAMGRGRHALSAIKGHVRASDLTLEELLRLLKLADHEMADAQSALMEAIDVNDRGEPI